MFDLNSSEITRIDKSRETVKSLQVRCSVAYAGVDGPTESSRMPLLPGNGHRDDRL
jgi:hypothetical protein